MMDSGPCWQDTINTWNHTGYHKCEIDGMINNILQRIIELTANNEPLLLINKHHYWVHSTQEVQRTSWRKQQNHDFCYYTGDRIITVSTAEGSRGWYYQTYMMIMWLSGEYHVTVWPGRTRYTVYPTSCWHTSPARHPRCRTPPHSPDNPVGEDQAFLVVLC